MPKNIYDPRVDPGKQQLTSDVLGTGADILKTTGSLAATGASIGGPIGAGVGAAAGLGLSLVEAITGKSDRVEARNDLSSDWLSRSVKNYTSEGNFKCGGKVKGYKKGGKIKGKGTNTSDSIPMDVEIGSFITPAENSAKAFALGREFLGWKDSEVAERNGGNIDINASNGEVIFTPMEANKLAGMGFDLQAELAPNAEEGTTNFFLGGEVDPITKATAGNVGFDISSAIKDISGQAANNTVPTNPILPEIASKEIAQDVSEKQGFMDFLPEIASAAQIAGGTAGAIAAGRRPDINISNALKSVSSEVTRDAGYGLPSALKNELKRENERTRRATVNAIINEGGPGQIQKLQSVLKSTIDKNLGIELADFEAQEKKKKAARDVKIKTADMDYLIQKDAQDAWAESKAGFNQLLAAGVSNIIGADMKKKEIAMLEKTRDSSINFTLPS
jgi:hypothetical protein